MRCFVRCDSVMKRLAPVAFAVLGSVASCGEPVSPAPRSAADPASTAQAAPPATSTRSVAEGPIPGASSGATTAGQASGDTATATRATASAAKGPFPQSTDPALRDPTKANEKAPATFSVRFETTAGDFDVLCTRRWAPHGADRLYNLVKLGFYDDAAFFRVVKQPRPFVVQFGIHGNPEVSRLWKDANLPVDKPIESNLRGTVTYAMAGRPETRATQLFINLYDNVMLDKMGFAPVCKVTGDGMDAVERIESVYGEEPSQAQGEIQSAGNALLRSRFPRLDYIKTARLADAPPRGR